MYSGVVDPGATVPTDRRGAFGLPGRDGKSQPAALRVVVDF
jgi:hypothetical protein